MEEHHCLLIQGDLMVVEAKNMVIQQARDNKLETLHLQEGVTSKHLKELP